MAGVTEVAAATTTLVATHFILSHPLRRPIVSAIGPGPFLAVYSVVAVGAIGWMSAAYRAAPQTSPLWDVGGGIWAVATLVMLVAAILLMGSLVGNPALPNAGTAPVAAPPAARGVFAVTRHPMMWSFALWGACHIAVYPMPANIVVALGIIVLALVGAALQDRKKEALQPNTWRAWEARTSFWPFAAIAAGRAQFGGWGGHALGGGLVVWLAATWAHIPIAGWPAGIWRWIV